MTNEKAGTAYNPISSISFTTNLFRQPHQIGDIAEKDGNLFLILGIENFRVTSKTLIVTFTCQSLETKGQQYPKKGEPYSPYTLINAWFKYNGGGQNRVQLGKLTEVKGKTYKLMEYARIYLVGTDVHVDVLGKEIHPVDNDTLKKKSLQKRMADMNFELR